jgi:hypothetical protein
VKKLFVFALCALLLTCCVNLAGSATSPPNLVGVWTGTARGVGNATTFIPSLATAAGIAITLTFTKQVDIRFIANAVLSPPLGGGTTERVSGVIVGDEIHGVDASSPVSFHGKLLYNPPGKPRIEGYFFKFVSGGDNPALIGTFSVTKTTL